MILRPQSDRDDHMQIRPNNVEAIYLNTTEETNRTNSFSQWSSGWVTANSDHVTIKKMIFHKFSSFSKFIWQSICECELQLRRRKTSSSLFLIENAYQFIWCEKWCAKTDSTPATEREIIRNWPNQKKNVWKVNQSYDLSFFFYLTKLIWGRTIFHVISYSMCGANDCCNIRVNQTVCAHIVFGENGFLCETSVQKMCFFYFFGDRKWSNRFSATMQSEER